MSSLRDHYDRITEPYPVTEFDPNLISSSVKADREIVCRGSDFTNQNPVGTDNPLQVLWGPAVNTPSDDVNIDASGNIFINRADNYHFRISLQYGRTGSGGTAFLWFRFLVNGTQAGVSVYTKLATSNVSYPYQAELTATLPAGVVVTGQMWRGSEGTNDGGLLTQDPILADGNASTSADIIVSKYTVKPI